MGTAHARAFGKRLEERLADRGMSRSRFCAHLKRANAEAASRGDPGVPCGLRQIGKYLRGETMPRDAAAFAKVAAVPVILDCRWEWLYREEGEKTGTSLTAMSTNTAMAEARVIGFRPDPYGGAATVAQVVAALHRGPRSSTAARLAFVDLWNRYVESSSETVAPADGLAAAKHVWRSIETLLRDLGVRLDGAPSGFYAALFGVLSLGVPGEKGGADLRSPRARRPAKRPR